MIPAALTLSCPYHIETSPLMNWFLYDRDLRHERDKDVQNQIITSLQVSNIYLACSWLTWLSYEEQ